MTKQPLNTTTNMATFGKSTSKHGIPNSSDMPFVIPSLNNKRNSERFIQVSAVLKEYIKLTLPHADQYTLGAFSELFARLDAVFNSSQLEFCSLLAQHHNWFKLYVLSGIRDQGNLPAAFYDTYVNCPYWLISLLHQMDRSENASIRSDMVRITLSILDIHRVLTVPVAPSLATITDKGVDCDAFISQMPLASICLDLGIEPQKVRGELDTRCANHRLHETESAGPNGHALWASHLDAYELVNDTDLLQAMKSWCGKLGLFRVTDRIANIYGIFSFTEKVELGFTGGVHSKLHVLFHKGTKSRIIAIADYFTQAALSPLHSTLSSVLKGIVMDGTFDQNGAFKRVLGFTSTFKEVYSLDLSAATDRLPIKLQVLILQHLLGSAELAQLWKSIMVDRLFWTQNGHTVRYAVGQPMGFKTSFNMLALTHHFIVQWAAFNAGVKGYVDYAIVGDDCVLTGTQVKDEYLKIMKSLGVNISINKSVLCDHTVSIGAEFCKRLALNGKEITGLPVHSIVECVANPGNAVSLWDVLFMKGIFVDEKIWSFLSVLLPVRDLKYLLMLNMLPKSVTGLSVTCLPASLAANDTDAKFVDKYGFSKRDVESFYYYVRVTESLSKIDNMAKRVMSLLSIVTSEAATRPTGSTDWLPGGLATLSLALRDRLSKDPNNSSFSHPVQDAVKTLGEKVLGILNILNGSSVDFRSLIDQSKLDALRYTLDKKADYSGHLGAITGDRRTLEKALRMISKSKNADGSWNPVSYTGRIEGVSHLWTVRIAVGKPLLVLPHIPKITAITGGGTTRLDEAVGSVDLGDFMTLDK